MPPVFSGSSSRCCVPSEGKVTAACASPLAAPLENGSTESDMAVEEETWEQREEPEGEGEGGGVEGGGEGGGGGGDEILASGSTSQDDGSKEEEEEEMMEEEEEEVSLPKAAAVASDAPKKEHVNVVFIGHVGKTQSLQTLSSRVLNGAETILLSWTSWFSLLDAGKSTIGGQIM